MARRCCRCSTALHKPSFADEVCDVSCRGSCPSSVCLGSHAPLEGAHGRRWLLRAVLATLTRHVDLIARGTRGGLNCPQAPLLLSLQLPKPRCLRRVRVRRARRRSLVPLRLGPGPRSRAGVETEQHPLTVVRERAAKREEDSVHVAAEPLECMNS